MSDVSRMSPVRFVGIGELCELAGVTQRTLRYYEAEGLIRARRDRYNTRCYDWSARQAVLLLCQLRRAGLSLKDGRHILQLYERQLPVTDVIQSKVTDRLAELESARKALDDLLDTLAQMRAEPLRSTSLCSQARS